jgi:TM2 domain-containing membrane protein YozV
MALSSSNEKKELALAYALWCLSLVGICGVQRMYLGQVGIGLVFLFTFGFCGLAQLLDLLLLPDAVNQANKRLGFVDSSTSGPILKTHSTPASPTVHPVRASRKAPDDDELDQLLRQAEHAVQRAEQSSGEN